MRIFALETDVEKIKEKFCHSGECIVLHTYFHGLSFLFAIFREILITIILMIVAGTAIYFGASIFWSVGVAFTTWIVFVFMNVMKAYIDWAYDFILVTTDKVILMDQTSVFKREIMPIHIENIGGISTFTQYWNVFPFGGLAIHLKEGRGGEDITLKYVPRAGQVASVISDVVTQYQRRQYKEDLGSPIPQNHDNDSRQYLDPTRNPIQPNMPEE